MARVEFFFDLVSPYSYLAQTQIRRICAGHGAELIFRPFLLGAVHNATGNIAPAAVPAKARYLLRDLRRWAKYYGVPLNFPRPFPFTTVASMRAACWCEEQGNLDDFVREGFDAYWVDGKGPKGTDRRDEAEPLREIARRIGADPDKLAEAAAAPEYRDALRESTEEAVRRGAFGAPTFFVDGELFWGNDRLHFVEQALEGR
ncbi:2-hydroxychromene-2-carboxylate isomerase [Rubrobacter taiwanensis]|jgi:2-hydroxychromene-2-carboxylate isomerase|uniref:2-hydroxychromene-2-carboxylate isomerase n=1 Tax=Rubrobacter taiwanensis TaxID=185139 RepID=A0A4R1BD98_9ACTN|nr:2-hydroxychromene-2-carboxylate isomerase [Rubrobacter taiwanensis]TCJ15075.1 2-hydroxychromene-2-carboxylate isomerase [Rubrobacter taiwanensis]